MQPKIIGIHFDFDFVQLKYLLLICDKVLWYKEAI